MEARNIALLVDDVPDSRAAQKTRLEAEGYSVVVAQNQGEALSRAREVVPRVIVLHLVATGNLNMPLIQALRSDDSCRHIPIVIVRDRSVAARKTNLHPVPHDSW